MIPSNSPEVFERGLSVLEDFGEEVGVRGRFVALYLGLRRIGRDMAGLGDTRATPASEIEGFLDQLYTKTHRPQPLIVLTALFGQSTSPTAPWSTRTGEVAPANRYPTNTWRNNFGIQKGVGCPAEARTIPGLIRDPQVRLSCPWMRTDDEGRHTCGIDGTVYRGEEHSIWLRKVADEGYQVVDLDQPNVYAGYLSPGETECPYFPLDSGSLLICSTRSLSCPKKSWHTKILRGLSFHF